MTEREERERKDAENEREETADQE